MTHPSLSDMKAEAAKDKDPKLERLVSEAINWVKTLESHRKRHTTNVKSTMTIADFLRQAYELYGHSKAKSVVASFSHDADIGYSSHWYGQEDRGKHYLGGAWGTSHLGQYLGIRIEVGKRLYAGPVWFMIGHPGGHFHDWTSYDHTQLFRGKHRHIRLLWNLKNAAKEYAAYKGLTI